MKKLMQKINMQTFLYLYIIICPLLDMTSFIFRNALDTSYSPSTFMRPIIAIVILLYIFIKDKKQRKFILVAGVVYGAYAILHLYNFRSVLNGSSYAGIIHELQYLINYTFMIMNLYIYIYAFVNEVDTNKLYKCVLTSITMYIVSIYIAIITGTSSNTYPLEQIGYKGWFESGNSISAILILSMFMLFNLLNKKDMLNKIKIWNAVVIVAVGIYLVVLIGTRTGLYGFLIVAILFAILNILYDLVFQKKNKKVLIGIASIAISGIIAMLVIVILIGSNTFERRKKVQEMANYVIDATSNEVAHITGDMLDIKTKIEEQTLEEDFMSEAQQQAVLSLNEKATKYNLSVAKMRSLQLIYNIELVKNQKNLLYVLFGNGYVSQYREMILEMEVPAILINFGICGFILYLCPFIMIFIYSIYKNLKNIKKIDVEDVMLISGSGLAFVISCLSGYVFFNASTTMIIILLSTLIISKVKRKE